MLKIVRMRLVRFIFSRLFIKQLLLSGLFLVLLVWAVGKWLGFSTNHDQKIQVPDLTRMELDKATKTLAAFDLNYVVLDSMQYHPDFPKRSVIEQRPEAGDFVKEKRKIYLTLNPSGYKRIPMPDFYGKTNRQARAKLIATGFRIDPEVQYVPDVAKDVVRGLIFRSTAIRAGDSIPKNALVTLILGDGKGNRRYRKH